MPGDLETHHMLALSMDHMKQETCDRMVMKRPTGYDYGLPVFYDKPENGFFIPVCAIEAMPDECPDDLVQMIDFARRLGFSWIMLDTDVEPIDDLPSYKV